MAGFATFIILACKYFEILNSSWEIIILFVITLIIIDIGLSRCASQTAANYLLDKVVEIERNYEEISQKIDDLDNL